MNDRRSLLVVRGVSSLVATLALIVGVPLLLAALVGWPLPARIPTLGSFEQAAQSGISDQVVVNSLAVVAWIVWAQLALALVTEAVGVARGRQAIHLPVLPAFQVTAARLVAGILMVASTVQPARAFAAPPPIPVAADVTAATQESIPDSPDPSSYGHTPTPLARTSDPTPPSPTPANPTVTVQRHDSYWAIAERTLGDGLRWHEILDLNVGRTLSDGSTISAGDDTLHSGWILVLPGDATVEPAAPPSGGPAPAAAAGEGLATLVVERGDNFWSISEDRLEGDLGREVNDPEVVPYWREVVAANRAHYEELVDADLIHPGQVVVLPPTGFERPSPPPPTEDEPPSADAAVPDEPPPATTQPPRATETPAAEETPPTTTAAVDNDGLPRGTVDESSQANPSEGEDSSDAPAAVALGALSSIALAVGLKRLLDRRRRRFVNENPGHLPGRTPAEQRELHQTVIAQADDDRIDDLQGVLGRLSASLAAMGSERRPRMIRHSDTSLEVLLDQPDTNAPAGWSSTDDGTVWTLVERPESDEPYDGPLSPSPLMVTVGQPEDDAQLYLDLEADGIVALTGDLDVATNLARSIVTELTLSPLADTLRVIAIGDVVDPGADVLEHLTIVDTWDGHAEDLVAWSTQSHAALAENGWANAFVGRGHDPDHDALVPIAVVADRPPPDELAAALRAAQPSSVAVVVVGEFRDAVATVCCEEDALNFDAINLACSPQELEADELAAISSLLVATDSPAEQELMDQLRAEFEASASSNGIGPADGDEPVDPVADETGHSADEPPGYDVLVRLLGDITVEGGEPLKPKATAVVAYLALHRSVTTDRLEEACWFGSDGTSHTKRIHDTMAESRSALGSQHFPANRSGKYVVGPHVGTDLDLFDWHVQRAAELPPDEAVEHYQAALELITGKPFSYPNAARASYGWVDFEHHATSWELRVAGVAQACAAIHLDAGVPAKAITMLRRIIQAIPLNGAVVETLMRAHIAADDRAGAESVYREHAAALDQAKLGDPEDSIEQLRLDLQVR